MKASSTGFINFIKMKKIIAILALFLISAISYSQVALKCGSGNYEDFDTKFNNIGQFHNDHLTNVLNNFNANYSLTYEQAINSIKDFNKSYYKSNALAKCGTIGSVDFINEEFDKCKYFVDNNSFIKTLQNDNNEKSLVGIVTVISNTNVLDANNKMLLEEISNIIKLNLGRSLINSDFENEIVKLTNKLMILNDGNKSAIGKELTGQLLSVGLMSCKWWRENPNAYSSIDNSDMKLHGPNCTDENYDYNYLPPVVGLDIAGALISSGVSIGLQWSNGSVNWSNVGQSAIMGAAGASTGIVGRVGRWISSLF